MRQSRTSGSVGAQGGRPPWATRPGQQADPGIHRPRGSGLLGGQVDGDSIEPGDEATELVAVGRPEPRRDLVFDPLEDREPGEDVT